VVDLMLDRRIPGGVLIGGEESGGIGISRNLPERDGLLNSLLLANVMADEKKTLGELVSSLQAEYGEHQYGRVDMHISEEVKQSAIRRAGAGVSEFAGMKVVRVETLDGIKFFLENLACAGKVNAAETWLLLRASGTEPLLRVYCESCSVESVAQVLQAAQAFVLQGEA
jgi:phosphomannomutase